jgi:hypothetical protein
MPNATVVVENLHHDLKTLPGGYVVIKRMNHGEKLTRQDLSSKMKINATKKSKDIEGIIDLVQRTVSFWEFKNLIVDHNLTKLRDPNDPSSEVPLNLKDERDIAIIDGKIAEEINTAISNFNNFEEDAEDEETDLGK